MRALSAAVLCLVILIFSLAESAVLSTRYGEYRKHTPETAHAPEDVNQKPWDLKAADDPVAVFTFLLVVIAGGQVCLFWWQLNLIRDGADDAAKATRAAEKQAVIAQNAYIARVRPWLDFKVVLLGGITWDDHNVSLTYAITIINHGPSPAVKVTIQEMVQPHSPMVEFNIQQRIRNSSIQMANAQKELISFYTNTVFPNTPFARQPITIGTPINGIEKLRIEYESRIKDSETPVSWNWLCLKFMVLLTYETPGGNRRHHTWKSFDVVRLTPPPYGSYAFPMRENIPLSELTLKADVMSDYAE